MHRGRRRPRGRVVERRAGTPRVPRDERAATGPLPPGEPVRGIGALRAANEVVDLDEIDLAFDEDENAAVASLLSAAPEPLTATGGWPAYTAIRASYGRAAGDGYVCDEVLAPVCPEERR